MLERCDINWHLLMGENCENIAILDLDGNIVNINDLEKVKSKKVKKKKEKYIDLLPKSYIGKFKEIIESVIKTGESYSYFIESKDHLKEKSFVPIKDEVSS